MDVDMVDIRI